MPEVVIEVDSDDLEDAAEEAERLRDALIECNSQADSLLVACQSIADAVSPVVDMFRSITEEDT